MGWGTRLGSLGAVGALVGVVGLSSGASADSVPSSPEVDSSLVAALGPSALPPVGNAPTPNAADGVGPGDFIFIFRSTPVGIQEYGCTANFVWTDTAGNHYLGTAGHCLLPQNDPVTQQTAIAEANQQKLAQIDPDVEICTSNCWFGGQSGFVLNPAIGTTLKGTPYYARQYPDGQSSDLGDDFGLIELPAGTTLRPAVPVWGGPTGPGQLNPGFPVCFYGNAEGTAETFATKARSGVGLYTAAFTGGPTAWYAAIPAFEGDSGSAVVNCAPTANSSYVTGGSLAGTTAVGILTDLTTVGVEGTTVSQAVAMTAQDTGTSISLVTP